MALVRTKIFNSLLIRRLENKFQGLTIQVRELGRRPLKPKLRHPTWLTKKTRVIHNDFVTKENVEFIKEVVHDKYKVAPVQHVIENTIEWTPNLKRTGVIARKIGHIPMWLKNGKKIFTTMLQVLDNHVIKYYPPEEYEPPLKRPVRIKNKKGCLLLGAEMTDPSLFTKEYCGLFKGTGVMPTKYLGRFFISSDAILKPGTLVTAMHFSVGNYVDVRGCTIDRGFQGVMKRHGFSGMPASHGVTKTHRRGGNIGAGGEKARVWPGTKMPGHMGNRYRFAKGLKIWRINTKYNVLWVSGIAIPGETNCIVYIYDTNLPLRQPTKPVAFPTFFGQPEAEDIYDEEAHSFSDPTITFKAE